ncbi:AMP-dependent synthetase/ligase [Rubrivirga sp. IMCC43871]|uniref:AMP-dependent synthetase/ligase n=1 Tax=Rubrivirga sp. IMCC43871 TaxID=3391575 RepID=UPI00398FB84D
MALQIHSAAPTTKGEVVLGKTLPQLLDDAVEKYPNAKAFNQPTDSGWQTMSNSELRTAADELALGLLENGLSRRDHVAFFMNSDLHFVLADFATQIAGIVNAPLYTTYAPDNLVYVTQHAEAKAMFVTNEEMLANFAGWAAQVPDVKLVVLFEGTGAGAGLPDGVTLKTADALRAEGRQALKAAPNRPDELRDQSEATELATLIYTSGTTGMPKGVMLSHQNISSNVLAGLPTLGALGNQEETILTFLPMTHIFARTLTIGHVAWGQSLYFSNPDQLVAHLAEVRPTMFSTVPRVLEKVYDKVSLGVSEATGLKHKIGSWALGLARDYDLAKPDGGVPGWKHGLADKLVYSKLREKLGLTRVKTVATGGAALRADLAQSFTAFGIPIVQGYGLTETSPIITMNTPTENRAGTVGQPIAGVDVAIAEDGEILSRGPNTMMGYYKEPDKTAEVMDEDGWFHTGDIGEFTPDGFLKITDRKKALFKLSTGKYVIPQPIENTLTESALIEQAVVVGNSQKFCTALIFPNMEALPVWAKQNGITATGEALLKDPAVHAEFERLVAEANEGMDKWSQVQRFRLVPETMTVENEMLTPTMKVKRGAVNKVYTDSIDSMYTASVDKNKPVAVVA